MYPVRVNPPVLLDLLHETDSDFGPGTSVAVAGAVGTSTPIPVNEIWVGSDPALGVMRYWSVRVPVVVGVNLISTDTVSPTGIVVPSSTGLVEVNELTGGLALTMVTGRFPSFVMLNVRVREWPTGTTPNALVMGE